MDGLYAFLGLLLLAYAVSLIVRRNGQSLTWLDGWGTAGFELLVSCLVFFRASRHTREPAYAWVLGLGMCLWALGDFAMTIETLGGANPPTPSGANYLWASFFPFAYVGLMLMMRREVRRFTMAHFLDGVVACLVTATLFAAFAFHPIVKAAGGDATAAAVNLIYPVADLLLLVPVAVGIALLPAGRRLRWGLLAAASLTNAIGDTVALFPGLGATHFGFFANSIAWPLSLYLISVALWRRSKPPETLLETSSSGFVVPAVAAGLALLILFVGSLTHTDQAALCLATLTLVAAGVRFGLALLRLRALTEERHNQLAEAADAERRSREALQSAVGDYSQFAARVAAGDLTAAVAANGIVDFHDLSESLNTMVLGLAEISGEIQHGVHDMEASSAEILEAVSRQTDSAAQQSAAIQETSTTLNELRRAAEEAAQRATDVAAGAKDSVAVSDEATRAVETIARAMDEIRDRVNGLAASILELSERTQQIGEVTATVNGLADRSNLLALNAGIEAARAGEHGRGFAVVASEVRNLAEQSKDATAQVETILADIRDATSTAVQASKEGTKVVELGLELTGRAGEGIRSLTDTIRKSAHAAEQIAASAQQQSGGIEQIAQAMSNVNEETLQFLEGAHQSQQVAQDLTGLSGKLAAVTERYRV